MINLINNNLIYLGCFIVMALVGLYFLMLWLIRETVKDELKKIQLKRNKKRKLLEEKQRKMFELQKIRQINNENINNDMDSYIDPAEGYNEDNNQDEDDLHDTGYSGNRLNKNDINMRDIADGIR